MKRQTLTDGAKAGEAGRLPAWEPASDPRLADGDGAIFDEIKSRPRLERPAIKADVPAGIDGDAAPADHRVPAPAPPDDDDGWQTIPESELQPIELDDRQAQELYDSSMQIKTWLDRMEAAQLAKDDPQWPSNPVLDVRKSTGRGRVDRVVGEIVGKRTSVTQQQIAKMLQAAVAAGDVSEPSVIAALDRYAAYLANPPLPDAKPTRARMLDGEPEAAVLLVRAGVPRVVVARMFSVNKSSITRLMQSAVARRVR